jgi:hypothetical protein
VYDLGAALDARFGRETAAALTAALESRIGGRVRRIAWHTSQECSDYILKLDRKSRRADYYRLLQVEI